MESDQITGIIIIAASYCLTWYLLLKSMKIVRTLTGQHPEEDRETKSETEDKPETNT